jgi:hypothetical protein
MTFLLLQIANAVLAAASLWIHFRAPNLWDDQAMVYSILTGCLFASLTAILVGIALIVGEAKKSYWIHLVLTLAFAGVQGWLLWDAGKELGAFHLLQSRLFGSP